MLHNSIYRANDQLLVTTGEARQEFSVVLTARAVGGVPTPRDESCEVGGAPPREVATLTMDRSMRMRIERYLTGEGEPYIG